MDFYLNSISPSGRNQLVKSVVPEEILFDIISRVPFEGVFQSKMVCESWLKVFRRPEFVEKHLQSQLLQFLHFHNYKYYPRLKNNNGASDIGILFFVVECHDDDEIYDEEPNDDYYDMAYAEYRGNNNNKSSITYPKMLTYLNISSADELISSCDGLVCLSKENDAYVSICNPVIREYVNLPRCGKSKQVCYGFGCTNTDAKDYKVVRIIYYEMKDDECDALVQVYTLGSGTAWRDKGRIAHSFRDHSGVLVDGALHWLDNKGKIWAFSLVDEEFNFLTQTPSKTGNFRLAVLGGWLSYFQYDTKHTTLWSFKKIIEEQKSPQWSKVFSLWMPQYSLQFALTNKGEVLYWNGTSLRVYNLENEAHGKLYIEHFQIMHSEFSGILHVNSLISLRTIGENEAKIIGETI